ncbi:MAG: NUDIX hydrolase [Hyphomicrobiaceae bacterium]
MTMDATHMEAGHISVSERMPETFTRLETATVEIGLSAAILSVHNDEPEVLVVRSGSNGRTGLDSLPYGPFSPINHRTLEIGLRDWVKEQSGLELGYVEQLYTFGDRGRHAQPDDSNPHIVSVSYLALTRPLADEHLVSAQWRSWYDYFPWEDWRNGKPAILTEVIEPFLLRWTELPQPSVSPIRLMDRRQRLRVAFGIDNGSWDEEKILERYEILYEAGLIEEARRDGRASAAQWDDAPSIGLAMRFDHRRILATSIARIRAKIKYRPVVFELMDDEFTLFELQKTVEAILGPHLHKQNFRRLVESAGLVEPTGELRVKTGGRPAKLYRFRKEVVLERPAPGVRVKAGRG